MNHYIHHLLVTVHSIRFRGVLITVGSVRARRRRELLELVLRDDGRLLLDDRLPGGGGRGFLAIPVGESKVLNH